MNKIKSIVTLAALMAMSVTGFGCYAHRESASGRIYEPSGSYRDGYHSRHDERYRYYDRNER